MATAASWSPVPPERLARWLAGLADRQGGTAVDAGGPAGSPGPRGWAVGVAAGPVLAASRVGRGYVQSRTAAGGWSQQRYARRRAGQTAALVADAVDAAHDLLVAGTGAATPRLDAVVTGGDRLLLRHVATDTHVDRHLAGLGGLVSARVLDVPDPGLAVLERAVGQARSVLVRPV